MSHQVSEMEQTFLGYLAVHVDGDAYIGGLLVVDRNGDPVDFTYTDPVTLTWPTRVLFGPRLPAYIATRVLAPPLLKSASVTPTVLCFDDGTVLSRHCLLDAPVAVFAPRSSTASAQRWRPLDLGAGDANGESDGAGPS